MDQPHNNLLEQVRGCSLCASQLPFGPRPIIQINPKARILIAGQAPGRKVHVSGIPFADPSGNRLREWMGIDKTIFYNPEKIAILPMSFCFPGTGKSGDLPPLPECAKQWRKQLLNLLTDIQLTLLIGQYAQDWHLQEKKRSNLTQTVKSWDEYWPSVLPIPHPSPRNNRWLKKNPWFEKGVIPMLKLRVAAVI